MLDSIVLVLDRYPTFYIVRASLSDINIKSNGQNILSETSFIEFLNAIDRIFQ